MRFRWKSSSRNRSRTLVCAVGLLTAATSACSGEEPAFHQGAILGSKDGVVKDAEPTGQTKEGDQSRVGGADGTARTPGDSVFAPGPVADADSGSDSDGVADGDSDGVADGDSDSAPGLPRDSRPTTGSEIPDAEDVASGGKSKGLDERGLDGIGGDAPRQPPGDVASLPGKGVTEGVGEDDRPPAGALEPGDSTATPAPLPPIASLPGSTTTAPVAPETGGVTPPSPPRSEDDSSPGKVVTDSPRGPASNENAAIPPAMTLQKNFDVVSVKDVQGSFYLSADWTSQPIVLKTIKETGERSFQQITRPTVSATAVQGKAGNSYIETLPQSDANGVLDLLVVIDNSGSMAEEQANLSQKLAPLLSFVSASDWRIGVVTTDPADGCMRALISKGQPMASETFATAINAGILGSGNERGIEQAVVGFGCPNSPWVRQASTTAVLIVADEDNCSNGLACEANPWNTENYLLNYLQKNMGRKLGTDARIYGLFKHPSDATCTTAYYPAYQYASAVEKSGGTWGSICSTDYTNTLSKISKDVSSILKKQFALQTTPDRDSVIVTLVLPDGSRIPATNYTLTGTVITFNTPPPSNSVIEISYSTGKEPQLKTFALGNPAAPGTETVKIDGVTMPPNSYFISGQSITFVQVPAPESTISVSFRKDLPLLKSFNLGTGIDSSSLVVKANGRETAGYSYLPGTGVLSFSAAPADATTIQVSFSKNGGNQMSYPILTSGKAITDVKAQYADKTPVKVSAQGSVVSLLDAKEFRSGETLWIQVRTDSGQKDYTLPSVPVPGTLKLVSSLNQCVVGNNIVVTEKNIHVECEFTGQLKIDFVYEAYADPQRSFNFVEIADPNSGTWTVKVDGQILEASDYSRKGTVVTLNRNVPLQQTSRVSVTFSSQIL